jgi:hypothetical protein
MNPTTFVADAAGIATALGVLFGAGQLMLTRSTSRTSFEDNISRQYRELIKPQLSEALLGPLKAEERGLVSRYYEYLDLCNEQVFLRMQGRVRRRTWAEWVSGIEGNLSRAPLSDAWTIARDQLPEFQEMRLLHETRTDPRLWSPRWRRVLRRELPVHHPEVGRRARAMARRALDA